MQAYRDIIKGFPDQFTRGLEAARAVEVPRGSLDGVVVLGMGGSALGAELVNAYLDTRPDLVIHRDYGLPNDLTDKTLVIAVSYSGNTEETLDAVHAALAAKHTVVVLTTGGTLGELAASHKLPWVRLPTGMPPRLSLGVQFAALVALLGQAGVRSPDEEALIEAAAEIAQDREIEVHGREIARSLGRRIPLIYSGAGFAAVARNWKIKFNETGKVQAFWNELPEANHNELNAFTDGGERFHVLLLQDADDHARVRLRLTQTARLAQEQGLGASLIETRGSSRLARLLHTVWLGDWVAFEVANARGFDPAATPLIENLKSGLAKKG